jgi:hypothetical protein
MLSRSLPCLGLFALLCGVVSLRTTAAQPKPAPAANGPELQYNRDVRPILAENCFACHGPDSAARKGKLRLDRREDAVERGAIDEKKLGESELLARILLKDDDDLLMPPKSSHKKLTPAQKTTIKLWLEQGAKYQSHWSFIPPKAPPVPAVKNREWVRNPIDAFVLADLEKAGLAPAPEADRRTLARRLALDITGLPPKVEDVEAFVKDESKDSYETYIDKLMASKHWGEHRGRYWLDAARFADTHGIHFDNYRENWAYREWVINAFNRNMRFDQFTIEQLAGDLLPKPTTDQLVATGFNRCNITTNEGGAISEEYLVLYTRDRTETVNQVWLGLTAGCAVCHDHKFDPISMKEFYGMSAFFNNTTQNAMDGNIPNTPPVIPVPRMEDRQRFEELARQIAALKERTEARKVAAKPEFEAWLKTAKPGDFAAKEPGGQVFRARLNEAKGKEIEIEGLKDSKLALTDGHAWFTDKDKPGRNGLLVQPTGKTIELPAVGDFDLKEAFSVSAWVRNGKRNQTGAILGRMEAASGKHRGWDLYLQGDKVGFHLIHSFPGNYLKVVAKNQLPFNQWKHVALSYDGSGKAAGVKLYYDGELQPLDLEGDSLDGTTRTKVPLKFGQRNTDSRVANVALNDLRIFRQTIGSLEAGQLAGSQRLAEIVAKPKRTPQETDELFQWWLGTHDSASQATLAELRKLQAEETTLRGKGTVAHISVEKKTPPEAYILVRGEYDRRGEKVGPITPAALPPYEEKYPRNRLGFAQWLLSKDHPLTARVTVNRFWQEVFGQGIVRTSGDFGITGEQPSHPELLDWLAEEFERDWDVQRFFKLVLMSNTYRQAAVTTKEKAEKDPFNRLLSRGPRFRMDAEMVRDYALAASGLLVPKIGGPSVKPYQPEGVWEAVAMIGSNTRNYKADSGENLYRRSMYTFWKRAAPPASMEVFNAPNRETCAVKRERTNTPLQALVTLNDIQFVEAARNLAERTLKAKPSTDERIDLLAKTILARPFRSDEASIVKSSIEKLNAEYKSKPEEAKKLISVGESKADASLDAGELAAWTMLCNELLNLDEVLNK